MSAKSTLTACGLLAALSLGCAYHDVLDSGPDVDRPFPLGAVTDAHWETQQTNAEAADFIMYDHEFKGDTVALAPGAKRHLEQMALRLEHVPFPIVIEQSMHNDNPQLDKARRTAVVEHLARMGLPDADGRVVVAPAFAEGFTGIEGENAYYNVINSGRNGMGGGGRRFGVGGGMYR